MTYIPSLEGYFREALDVLQTHLASLHASLQPAYTSQDYDLCIFDNGSCPEVIAWLQEHRQAGWIDWLALSNHNLGKNGALNWIFGALPNEFIAYSDSDVFFRPGWLEASLKIFDSFERAGMVSAQPVFFDFLRGQGATARQLQAAGGDLKVEMTKPRPEILEEYCDGINASPELRQQFRQQSLQVAVNQRTGTRAVTSATDMQFMLSKEVARKLVPLPIAGALTAKDAIDIPRGIEALGYWILSAEEPLVWHMGNSIQEHRYPEIDRLIIGGEAPFQRHDSSDAPSGTQSPAIRKPVSSNLDRRSTLARHGRPQPANRKARLKNSLRRLIRRSPTLKRACERIYGGLFSLLYEEQG